MLRPLVFSRELHKPTASARRQDFKDSRLYPSRIVGAALRHRNRDIIKVRRPRGSSYQAITLANWRLSHATSSVQKRALERFQGQPGARPADESGARRGGERARPAVRPGDRRRARPDRGQALLLRTLAEQPGGGRAFQTLFG